MDGSRPRHRVRLILITCWCLIFGLLLVLDRLIRRYQRKGRHLQRAQLARMQAMMAGQMRQPEDRQAPGRTRRHHHDHRRQAPLDQVRRQSPVAAPWPGLSSGSGYTSVARCEATGEDEREGAVMDSRGDLPRRQRRHREEPAALADGDRGVLIRMTPDEIQILVLAELPDVPVTTGRKPITDCTREDLAFAIDDYYQAAASLSRSAAGETGLWPDWDRHLARVAAAKAELLELMREQMDEARGAAKVSDLWLGPMEDEFRTRRGRRGE